jgi:hypothetical protein
MLVSSKDMLVETICRAYKGKRVMKVLMWFQIMD